MGIFSRFPYTDFHRLNADWILDKIKEMLGLTQQAADDAAAAADDAEAAAAAAEQAVDGSVRYDRVQELTSQQKLQAQQNMNVVDASHIAQIELFARDLDSRSVQVEQQNFGSAQQAQARSNIGAASAAGLTQLSDEVWGQGSAITTLQAGAVQADRIQAFTDAQKAQARANIGAAAEGSGPAPVGAVLYDQAQSLTTAQKTQARSNIGALPADDPRVSNLYIADGTTEIQLYADPISSLLYLDGFSGSSTGLPVRISGVATPTSGNDAANKDYADSIRGPLLSNITGDDVILQPDAVNAKQNTLYVCTAAELNSLEINPVAAPAANREFTVRFTSGATPTELDTPLTILGLDDLVPAANTIYEINVLGNLAVWHSWEVPSNE